MQCRLKRIAGLTDEHGASIKGLLPPIASLLSAGNTACPKDPHRTPYSAPLGDALHMSMGMVPLKSSLVFLVFIFARNRKSIVLRFIAAECGTGLHPREHPTPLFRATISPLPSARGCLVGVVPCKQYPGRLGRRLAGCFTSVQAVFRPVLPHPPDSGSPPGVGTCLASLRTCPPAERKIQAQEVKRRGHMLMMAARGS